MQTGEVMRQTEEKKTAWDGGDWGGAHSREAMAPRDQAGQGTKRQWGGDGASGALNTSRRSTVPRAGQLPKYREFNQLTNYFVTKVVPSSRSA